MSDNFIEEIKEEIRNEQIQRIWRDYGNVIIGTIIAIIVATALYIAWHSYQENQLNERTIAFETQLEKLNNSDQDLDLEALKTNKSKGYELLGSFLVAGQKSSFEAASELQALSESARYKSFYKELAALQGIMRKFDDTNGRELLKDLEPLLEGKTIVRVSALELVGYAHMKLNNRDQALNAFKAVSEDPNAPQSMMIRARAMMEVLSRS